jgi:hypothetical protein
MDDRRNWQALEILNPRSSTRELLAASLPGVDRIQNLPEGLMAPSDLGALCELSGPSQSDLMKVRFGALCGLKYRALPKVREVPISDMVGSKTFVCPDQTR